MLASKCSVGTGGAESGNCQSSFGGGVGGTVVLVEYRDEIVGAIGNSIGSPNVRRAKLDSGFHQWLKVASAAVMVIVMYFDSLSVDRAPMVISRGIPMVLLSTEARGRCKRRGLMDKIFIRCLAVMDGTRDIGRMPMFGVPDKLMSSGMLCLGSARWAGIGGTGGA